MGFGLCELDFNVLKLQAAHATPAPAVQYGNAGYGGQVIIHSQGQQPFVVGQPQGNIIAEMIKISKQILQNLFFAITICTITPLVIFFSSY